MLILSEYISSISLTIVIFGAAYLVLPHCRREKTWIRALLVGIVVFLSWRYVAWRFASTVPPLELDLTSVIAWSFAGLEALATASSTLALILLSRTRERHTEANRHEGWWGDAEPPRIDVYIATYNEGAEILQRTIAGAQAIAYPNARIFVLDDGRRVWLQALCQEKGVGYITRPDNSHAKAGNINNAFEVRRDAPDAPDFIAILDADFVPHSQFLDRAVSLFHDPGVALVQTPQHFFNPDPIQHNLGIANACPDEQRFFFNHVQPSRDAWGMAICCGTSSLIRTSALAEIGGVPTESVTEDLLLTLRLGEYGYRTVYLNEALSEGLAPEGLSEYINQRARWCLGMMQIVRGPYNPLGWDHKLILRQRISVLDSFLFWSTTFPFRLAGIVVPLLYWYFGVLAVNAEVTEVLSYFLPAFAASLIALNWLSRGLIVPFVTDVAQLVASYPITRAVMSGLLMDGPRSFKVTDKGGSRDKKIVQWHLARPFIILLGLSILGLCLPLISDFTFRTPANDGVVVILFWTLYNLFVLMLAIFACVELPRSAGSMRRQMEPATLFMGVATIPTWVTDLGPDHARIRGPSDLQEHSSIQLKLDGIGTIQAEVSGSFADSYALRLLPTGAQIDLISQKLHTAPGAPGTEEGNMPGIYAGLLRRLLLPKFDTR